MPVIRWIMKHTVIVFVGVLLVAGYVYRDQIKTELTQMGVLGASSTKTASANKAVTAPAKAPDPVAAQGSSKANTPSAPVSDSGVSSGQMPTTLATQEPAPAPATTGGASEGPSQQGGMPPYGYGPQGMGPQGMGNMPYNRQMMPPQGYPQGYPQQGYGQPYGGQAYGQRPMQPQMQPQMPPQMPPQMAMRAPQPSPVDAGLTDDVKKQWVAARTAYWKGDKDTAEALYKALVDSSKEADVAGELGNLYFADQRYDDAAAMFYEAGVRYLDSDTPMMAGMVMGPLSQIAPQKADALRQMMMEKRAKAMEEQAAARAASQGQNQAPDAPAN